MPPRLDLDALRRHAVARSLFAPTTLMGAVQRLGGFVQADPLRAPARAQDLTLRHRVKGYQAGDLERRYPRLDLQEDFFINYGFVTPQLRALMHPRSARRAWDKPRWKLADAVLAEVERLGEAHPADVDAALGHGPVKNWFGGNSRLSTELLDGLHYRGRLDVVRRDSGTRVYRLAPQWEAHPDPQAAMDAMADALVQKYAPLPAGSLSTLISMLASGAHQWQALRRTTFARAKERLAHARVDGTDWYWPAGEDPTRGWRIPGQVRLLAPFDPVVWDRRRFELLWGWAYRFEAYTPAAKRVRGHYALPLLWRDQVIGWANAGVKGGELKVDCGYVAGGAPRDAGYQAALDEEIQRLAEFLGVRR
jgi:uncharacterized protein YcaQ